MIDRDALLKHQRKMRGFELSPEDEFWDYAVLAEDIRNAPTIDPVVHGRWLLDGRCSECLENPLTTHRNFCPNCGAKMDLEG